MELNITHVLKNEVVSMFLKDKLLVGRIVSLKFRAWHASVISVLGRG